MWESHGNTLGDQSAGFLLVALRQQLQHHTLEIWLGLELQGWKPETAAEAWKDSYTTSKWAVDIKDQQTLRCGHSHLEDTS